MVSPCGGSGEHGSRYVSQGHELSPLSRMEKRGDAQSAGYANFERIGAQLHHHDSRFDARDESPEGHLSQLGDSLCRPASVRTPLPRGMACEDLRDRGTPSCGTLLRAVRHLGGFAPGSTAGTFGRESETSSHETTTADSLDWPDPRRSDPCDHANP